jgi:hypothetical protein
MNATTKDGKMDPPTARILEEKDIQDANELIRKQALFALSLLTGCLEGCNVLVQSWIEGRRQAISRMMKTLAEANDEPDANKRATLVSTAYMDEVQVFVKDLTAANMQAFALATAYVTKTATSMAMESRAAASASAGDVAGAPQAPPRPAGRRRP